MAILWGTMAGGVFTAVVSLFLAWIALPWYAAVIVGGGVLLMAPLVLQLFPDSFVDGRSGLLVFAGVGCRAFTRRARVRLSQQLARHQSA